MSGGQQQRASIAGMLAMNPAMLVLDEPTAMLDESARAEVMRILDDLQRAAPLLCMSRIIQMKPFMPIASCTWRPGESLVSLQPSIIDPR